MLKINKELQHHIWPLKPEELEQLEKNILAEGIREAILTWKGYIVDGHNRYTIATKHGLEYETKEIEFSDIDAVKDWMDANQIGRRNLTIDQLQISIGRRYNREKKAAHGRAGREFGDANIAPPKTADSLATEYKVSPRTIHNYAQKAAEFERLETEKPEIFEAVRSGEMTLKEVQKEQKREEVQKNIETLKQKEIAPSTGKYDVIVIDPPWQMEKIERDVAPDQVGFDYPTMSIDDIKSFSLPSEKNCHVFMWITQKHHRHGFDIFDSWGVKFICEFVWHKNGGFQPFGLPQFNHEYIMYGRIGTPQFVDFKNFFTCFNAQRTGHSAKPEEFYETLRRVTAGKRIDIFNRRDIKGFDKWGNEACQ